MALIIGVPNSADSEQIVTLDRRSYILQIRYNNRASFWTVSLYTANREPIILGEKVVPSQEFLQISAKNLEVNGFLGIRSEVDTPVTRDNFGVNGEHRLVFLSQREVDNAISS